MSWRRSVEDGAVVAAASRYAPGGRQVGGPPLKEPVVPASRNLAQALTQAGTTDATNSFKAYSAEFAGGSGWSRGTASRSASS